MKQYLSLKLRIFYETPRISFNSEKFQIYSTRYLTEVDHCLFVFSLTYVQCPLHTADPLFNGTSFWAPTFQGHNPLHTNSQFYRPLVTDDLDSFKTYSDGSLFGVITVALLLFFLLVVLIRLLSCIHIGISISIYVK